MGIYDREYYRDDGPQGFSLERITGGRSVVTILLIINIAVFVLDGILAEAPPKVLLSLYETDISKPWLWFRCLTYGFAHADFNHILGNMIGLFFFGRAIEGLLGPKRFLWMYLTALIAGSVVWMIGTLGTQSDVTRVLLGASGGVVATVLLFCLHYPHQKVYLMMVLPMPAWVLGIAIVLSDVYGALGRPGAGVAFGVHLVGTAYAFLYFKTHWDISQLSPGGLGGLTKALRPGPKLRVHNPNRPQADDTLAQKADEVLKKLHQQGEASLTARERKILEDYSRRIKQKR